MGKNNNYAEYKNTKMPWLQQMPARWDVARSKNLYRKETRAVRPGDDVVTCFRDGTVTLRKNRRVTGFTESIKEVGYQGIRKGDLVIHVMDAFAGAIGVSASDGKGSPVYSVCTAKIDLNNKYYAHVLREMARQGYIKALYRGIRERSSDFRFETFGNLLMPMPTKEEQDQIVRYLDSGLAKINKFIKNKKRLIGLLIEQKQAVINQAVTKGLDPAAKMKPSSVEWLGDVPEGWEIVKLKHQFRIISGCGFPIQLQGKQEGDYPFFKASDINKQEMYVEKANNYVDEITAKTNNFTVVKEKTILMAKIGEALKKNHRKINVVKCIIDNNLQAMALKPGIDIKYAYYLLRCIDMLWFDNGGTVPSINNNKLLATKIPLPKAEIQASIVDYIERQEKGIDQTIDRIKKEIDLITEYRTALISAVVTGKVDVRAIAVEETPAEDLAEPDLDDIEGEELKEDDLLESEVS